MHALLHNARPTRDGLSYVMSDRHDNLYLHAKFDDAGDLLVTSQVRFVAAVGGQPKFVSVWDGPFFRTIVALDPAPPARAGDTVAVDLFWRMKREQ